MTEILDIMKHLLCMNSKVFNIEGHVLISTVFVRKNNADPLAKHCVQQFYKARF